MRLIKALGELCQLLHNDDPRQRMPLERVKLNTASNDTSSSPPFKAGLAFIWSGFLSFNISPPLRYTLETVPRYTSYSLTIFQINRGLELLGDS